MRVVNTNTQYRVLYSKNKNGVFLGNWLTLAVKYLK